MTVANGAIEGLDLPLIVADAKEGNFEKWRREAGRSTPFDSSRPISSSTTASPGPRIST